MMLTSEAPWLITRTLTPASRSAANTFAAIPTDRIIPSPTTATSARSVTSETLSGSRTRRISSMTSAAASPRCRCSTMTLIPSMLDGQCSMLMRAARRSRGAVREADLGVHQALLHADHGEAALASDAGDLGALILLRAEPCHDARPGVLRLVGVLDADRRPDLPHRQDRSSCSTAAPMYDSSRISR
jgi:hypothetical protein